jgi:hypothetical protein
MKDLWADLNVDGDDEGIGWSLEQLERELAHLDDSPEETTAAQGPPGLSAATLVVSHANIPSYTSNANVSAADAWSQSLANFQSLEQEFLAADSAKRSTNRPPPGLSAAFLDQAEDYNIAEQLQAPPGMIPPVQVNVSRTPRTPKNSSRQLFTATPQNSLAQLPVENPMDGRSKTPQNSLSEMDDFSYSELELEALPIIEEQQIRQQNIEPALPAPIPPTPSNSMVVPQGIMSPQMMSPPPQGMMMPPLQGIMMMPIMASPQMMQSPGPPAWQTRPPPQPPIYANVHPNAPPIPASALESSLMKSRDLAYVIHSMLKPVLMMGTSTSDYHMRLLQRQAGPATAATPNKKDKLESIMSSRAKKAAEWKETQKTLGSTTKADITRPRALIATPTLVSDEDLEQGSRASLWKARLHIDQGYQAMSTLVEVWQQHAPGSAMPAEVQTHLLKLLKCLGMSAKDGVYSIQPDKALTSILKMTKGQIFLARVLEQALLPPKAVQVLLPPALEASILNGTPNDMVDSRLFGGYTRVISSIPLEGDIILACIQKVQTKDALLSQARMECVHALLRGGSVRAAQDPEGFGVQWSEAEVAFVQLLQ